MTRDLSTPAAVSPSDAGTRLADRANPAAEAVTLGELAAQFESMLMLEMIKQMRKSLLDEEAAGEGLGKETYSSTIDSELALHLARAGGLGLTPAMVDAWTRQQSAVAPGSITDTEPRAFDVAPRATDATAAAETMSVHRHASPVTAANPSRETSAVSLEMAGRVSSAYGWRGDPFSGRARFHGGIDLAAGYGAPVPAAAHGTVVTAEEQGGYGLTVVIRHQNGFESRYAHLSSFDVRPGQTVAQGQQLGRVGSTGRSTGPHLHFEVTQAGRRVDPAQFVRNLTGDIKGQ